MVGGSGDFQCNGIQAYILAGMFDVCRRKNAGSSVMLRFVNFCTVSWTVCQKFVSLGHDQKICTKVPFSARHRQQKSDATILIRFCN